MENVYKVIHPPKWPYFGEFFEETVYVICGYRYSPYLSLDSFHSVPNRSSHPERKFVIQNRDVITLPRNIIGISHRHPPGLVQPSEADFIGLPRGLFGAVWCEGQVTFYNRNGIIDVDYLP